MIKPVNNNICVEPFELEGSKVLHIPPSLLRKGQTVQRGTVKVSASDAVKDGEVVIFQKYSGDEMVYKDQKFVMIKPAAIIAIE